MFIHRTNNMERAVIGYNKEQKKFNVRKVNIIEI